MNDDEKWEDDLPDIKTTQKGVDYISDGKVAWIIRMNPKTRRRARLRLVKPTEKDK